MTIYGTVSSINANGSVMLQSYAWGGASGSLVFDDRARIVGILKAIDVNRSGVSPYPQINENVVITRKSLCETAVSRSVKITPA